MKKIILLLGYRFEAVKALHSLGYNIVLWDPHKIALKTKESIFLTLQDPYPDDITKVSPSVLALFREYSLHAVIAVKEKTLMLAAKLREILSVPGVSSNVALLCHDKWHMKQYAQQCGISITDYELIVKKTDPHLLAKKLGFPCVLKPRTQSGRRGLQIVHTIDDLKKHMKVNSLAEKYIEGRECSVESFVLDGKIVFTNITDYHRLTHCNIVPAQLPKKIVKDLIELNLKVIEAFHVKQGMAHTEYYLTEDRILFGEITIRPPGGYLMDLISLAYACSAWKMFLAMEMNIPIDLPKKPSHHTAVWVIHPGSGEVVSIEGVEDLKKLPELLQFTLKCKIGDTLKVRLGVGEDYGNIVLQAEDAKSLLRAIKAIEEKFHIHMV